MSRAIVPMLGALLLVGTACAPAEEKSRTIHSFEFIGAGTTLRQVVAKLGAPDRDIGSGIHIYVYELADGTEVWVGSPGEQVWYVRHGSKTLYEQR